MSSVRSVCVNQWVMDRDTTVYSARGATYKPSAEMPRFTGMCPLRRGPEAGDRRYYDDFAGEHRGRA